MRAVLFDLDGTLLDLDLASFLKRYYAALEAACEPLASAEVDARALMTGIDAAVRAMMNAHPGQTNRDVFYEAMCARTGVDLNESWHVFERFYADVFPALRDTARPAAGGRAAVTAARDLGLLVAIATNPIFPAAAIAHRLDWAGLGDLSFDLVTSYEVMHACKPHAAYYREIADVLEVSPSECLMVGDDRSLDLPAADTGMLTYYVGAETGTSAAMSGDLEALAELLPRLV